MKLTVGEILDKITSIRSIVKGIESGGSIDYCSNEIAEYLDEYMRILSNTKIDI